MEFRERFYRRWANPVDLISFEVKIKETDMFCSTTKNLKEYIEKRVIHYRYQLESYSKENPFFLESLFPLEFDPFAPPIIRDMLTASKKIGIGPMATVAGAIAEYVGKDIMDLTNEFIIENGGDIFLKTEKERVVCIFSGDSPFGRELGIRIKPAQSPLGICTSSGKIGPSLSFGHAHAVCVLCSSALLADGFATYIGNMVKSKEDIRQAIDVARAFEEIKGIIVVIDDCVGLAGNVEIVEVK